MPAEMGPGPQPARRTKLCHLIHFDGPGGGPTTVINHLTYYTDYFDVAVIHGGYGRIARVCTDLNIPHFQLPIDRLSMLPLAFAPLVNRLRLIRPDILLLHGQWAGFAGSLAGSLSGVPRTIYIAQWPAFYTDWDLWRVLRNRIVEAIPCRRADRVVALSSGNYYQYLLRRLVSEDRLSQIPNAIDPERIATAEAAATYRAELGWNDGNCHVVSVARLADQKRIDWLLKSWRIVADKIPHARLWIVGEGPDADSLRNLAQRLDITDTCTFVGQQNGLRYIAAADVVAMTSLYEGHANVPLEAMACRVPIVASDVDGVNDSFADGDAGYLVPPGNISLFAARLIELASNSELRATMGTRGQERVQRFSKSVVMRQYLALIREVLAA